VPLKCPPPLRMADVHTSGLYLPLRHPPEKCHDSGGRMPSVLVIGWQWGLDMAVETYPVSLPRQPYPPYSHYTAVLRDTVSQRWTPIEERKLACFQRVTTYDAPLVAALRRLLLVPPAMRAYFLLMLEKATIPLIEKLFPLPRDQPLPVPLILQLTAADTGTLRLGGDEYFRAMGFQRREDGISYVISPTGASPTVATLMAQFRGAAEMLLAAASLDLSRVYIFMNTAANAREEVRLV
jgi:hypothetical protein